MIAMRVSGKVEATQKSLDFVVTIKGDICRFLSRRIKYLSQFLDSSLVGSSDLLRKNEPTKNNS